MKAIVAHHYWDRVGGGELVDSFVVKVLQKMGYEVIIVATTGFDERKYEEWFGIDMTGIKKYVLLDRLIPMFGIYQRLLLWVPLRRALSREKPDILWIDNEIYKLANLSNVKVIEYIHFPTPEWRLTPDYFVKYRRFPWNLYFYVFLAAHQLLGRENPFHYADVVACNSTFIRQMIRNLWGGEALVIHPPVLVDQLLPFSGKGYSERDGVAMIGRLSPEKRYEDVVEAISLSETKPVLRIVGGIIPSKMSYLYNVLDLAEKKNVRVEIYANVPRERLIEVVSSSRIFVHACRGEHFGIATVEGMALGCPIVVHRSGGTYMDIIQYDQYGMSFSDPKELAMKIDLLNTDENMWRKYHELSLQRCKKFDSSVFEKKVRVLIEKISKK